MAVEKAQQDWVLERKAQRVTERRRTRKNSKQSTKTQKNGDKWSKDRYRAQNT